MMSHEEIKHTLSGMVRQIFETRLKQLQELKAPLADFEPTDDDFYEEDWIAEIDIDEMSQYFEGSNTDELDEQIERAMDQSKLFRLNMCDIGYMLAEKLLNLKF